MGITYRLLGLYRRARRLFYDSGALYRRAGTVEGAVAALGQLSLVEMEMGHLESAANHLDYASSVGRDFNGRVWRFTQSLLTGRLAMHRHDVLASLRWSKHAATLVKDHDAGLELLALAAIARSQLRLGDTRAALATTRRGTRLHRTHDLAALQGWTPPSCGGGTARR